MFIGRRSTSLFIQVYSNGTKTYWELRCDLYIFIFAVLYSEKLGEIFNFCR